MSLPTQPLFAKTQDAYSSAVADRIAPAGFDAFTHFFSPRPILVPETKRNYQRHTGVDKAEQLRKYKTEWAAAKRKAERVNPESVSGFSSGMALHCKEIRKELERNEA